MQLSCVFEGGNGAYCTYVGCERKKMQQQVPSHKMNLFINSLECDRNHYLCLCSLVLQVLPCQQHKDVFTSDLFYNKI